MLLGGYFSLVSGWIQISTQIRGKNGWCCVSLENVKDVKAQVIDSDKFLKWHPGFPLFSPFSFYRSFSYCSVTRYFVIRATSLKVPTLLSTRPCLFCCNFQLFSTKTYRCSFCAAAFDHFDGGVSRPRDGWAANATEHPGGRGEGGQLHRPRDAEGQGHRRVHQRRWLPG